MAEDILPLVLFSLDIFLLITYLGISFYLFYIFSIWREPSIGSWAIGSLFISLAILFHSLSIITDSTRYNLIIIWFKLATLTSFTAYWFYGIAHLLARRDLTDFLLVAILTLPLGFIFPHIINSLDIVMINGIPVEAYKNGFTIFDLLYFIFFGVLYLILARDSQIIYNASIKKEANTYRKSIALGHLFAWQFWVFGTAAMRYLSKFTSTTFIFALPMILLLVPILTLGSRPFDWVREGYEPVFLLLIDQYGTPTYSWVSTSTTPLLMEGSTIATINNMLGNFIGESVTNMTIDFKYHTLYSQSSNSYLSLLLTTGNHKSFERFLEKIHSILVTDVVKQIEMGIPGYDFPFELRWLLSQLIPDQDFNEDFEHQGKWTRLLLRSGLNFHS